MALQAESGFQSEHLPSCRLQRPFPSFRNRLGLSPLLRAARLGGGPSAFTCGIALLCFAAALDPYMNGEPQSPPTKMPVALMDLLAERSAAAWPARCFCRALGRARSQGLRPKRARWSKSSHWAAPRVRQDARLYFWLPVGHKRRVSGMLRHGDRHSACAPAEGGFAACAVAA